MALASSFLFKHFVATSIELHDMMHAGGGGGGGGAGGVADLPPPPVIAEADRSAARSWVLEPKPTMTGTQSFPLTGVVDGLEKGQRKPNGQVVAPEPTSAVPQAAAAAAAAAAKKKGAASTKPGAPGSAVPHAAAHLQACGEAIYTDDAPLPANTLHGWLVRAPMAPARIVSIDAETARAMPGVATVMFADDLPPGGRNDGLGPIAHDEECFAATETKHIGQVVCIIYP